MLSPIRPRPTKPSCIDSSRHSEVPFSPGPIVEPERVDLHLPATVGRPFRVALGHLPATVGRPFRVALGHLPATVGRPFQGRLRAPSCDCRATLSASPSGTFLRL